MMKASFRITIEACSLKYIFVETQISSKVFVIIFVFVILVLSVTWNTVINNFKFRKKTFRSNHAWLTTVSTSFQREIHALFIGYTVFINSFEMLVVLNSFKLTFASYLSAQLESKQGTLFSPEGMTVVS